MAKTTMRPRAGQDIEIGTRPSKVFGTRLRELRRARRLTQEELAERMRAAGYPLSKSAIVRIEKDERGISLDEALALTLALGGVFAQMLTPAGEDQVAVHDSYGFDGDALRSWLRTGDPFTGGREEQLAEIDEIVVRRAQALVDAGRNNDNAGAQEAIDALAEALDYRSQPEYRSYTREMLDREAAEA
jgi:transcriptional regulator with XRE-family HTH domain